MVFAGTWETEDLVRHLDAVDSVPDRTFLEQHFDSLAAFTPEGFRYVLPYYLRYSLDNPTSEITERIVFHLSPSDPETDYWQSRLNAFSSAQKDAVCQYLRHMQSALGEEGYDEDLTRALSTWGC
jgi:hypothetical protein